MIVGKRIQLRAIEYEDLPLLVKWRNDPEVYRYFFEHEPLSLVMQRAWFEKYLTHSDEKFWIVETKDTLEAIGTVGLFHLDWRNRKGEWGRLLIYPDKYRHGGYGAEVECLILRYFFDHMNMNRLEGEVYLENEFVWQLHQKFGFKQEGLYRQYVFQDGKYKDVVFIAMLREDYLSAETQARIAKYLEQLFSNWNVHSSITTLGSKEYLSALRKIYAEHQVIEQDLIINQKRLLRARKIKYSKQMRFQLKQMGWKLNEKFSRLLQDYEKRIENDPIQNKINVEI